jgi:putative spermidine/putrescine transport system substrate-binding protein
MRKILLGIVLGVVAAAILLFWWRTRPLPMLTVMTWPGAYGRAQEAGLMRPYAAGHRVDVHIAEYEGGLGALRRAVATHTYGADVFDMELPDAVAACAAGLLEPIDANRLPPGADGAHPMRDFFPGALGPCWVGSVVYSQTIAYGPIGDGSGPKPSRIEDFFDLEKFPGGRGLRRSAAKYNLELALLADGVKPSDIYRVLAQPAGVTRALAKLDTIRGAIVWWTSPGQPAELIHSGQARYSTILNGDIYDAAIHHQPLGVLWDRQLYEFDVFAIPKGDPKRTMALDFIHYATGAAPLAAVSDWVPYGPARRSAQALVGKNPELGIAMAPFLPTTPENFRTAFAVNDVWWHAHGAAIVARWRNWLAKAAH